MQGQSGASAETVPLPDGGGATRSIGDTFEPDLHTGTGTFGIPLWFPPGAGKLQPEMRLAYSTGGGNGPFGMGWSLEPLAITRRTDRGLPTYDETDTLLLGGDELAEVAPGVYRLRREHAFFRVERTGEGFVARDRRGRRFNLGDTAESRVAEGGRTAMWLASRVTDTNGNEIAYGYLRDGNRLYLQRIRYADCTVTLEYAARPDALTDRRYGFPVTTALRCTAITYRLDGDDTPFRRYDLVYDECPHSRLSLLASVTARGTRDGNEVTLPPLRFTYTPFEPSRHYVAFSSVVGAPPQRSLDDPDTDLVDLDGTGLPGVVELGQAVRRYWPNLGEGRWGAPRHLRDLPAPVALSDPAVAIADMDGDASGDLVLLAERPFGYYRAEAGAGWTERAVFRSAPSFAPADTQVRLFDLDSDGIVDAVRSGPTHWYAYTNRGRDGWDRPEQLATRRNGHGGGDGTAAGPPRLSLDDERVRLADMTGDGLIDLVVVRNGWLTYWPHGGFGRFADPVTLTFPPIDRRRFESARMFLSDVNGDGLADLLYVDTDRVYVWINQAGLSLAALPVIRQTPSADARRIAVVDMYGTGTAGLLWSLPWTRRDPDSYKYLDLAGRVRPYLLASIDHGVGRRTEIGYSPSTAQQRLAREEGRPWTSTLPFPVATLAEIVERDLVTGIAVTKRNRYFDGWFEPVDRELRGFGRVETTEVGDDDSTSTLTVSTFHQGRPSADAGPEDAPALAGRLISVVVFDTARPDAPLRSERNTYAVRHVDAATDGTPVLFGHLDRAVVEVLEGADDGVATVTKLDYDDLGNVVAKHESWDAGEDTQELVTELRYTSDMARWILDLPVERVERDGDGALLSLERFFYDGPAFEGLALGQVERGNVRRHERMVASDALLDAVFGADEPDLAMFGHHRITDPDGTQGWAVGAVAYDHDARGNAVRRRDERGQVTEIDYDARGIYPTRIRNPLGHTTQMTYDRRTGRLALAVDPNGAETRYRYDAVGRLTALIKPGDSDALPTVALHHDDAGLPLALRTEMRERSGQPSTFTQVEHFDGFGQLLQKRVQAEGGHVVVDGWRRRSARGWEVERTSPFTSAGLGYVADEGVDGPRRYRFDRDALGRVITAVTPDGRTSRTVYAPGQVTRYDVADTDDSPDNPHFDTPRVERHDARGNLLEVVESEGAGVDRITRYRWDPLGRLARITDAAGTVVATYTYDLLGRTIAVDHVDGGLRRAAHHPDGQIAVTIDAAGRTTTVDCDQLGRKTTLRVDGLITEQYTYDAGAGDNLVGRLAEVADEAGTLALSYGDRGLLAAKTRTVTLAAGGERSLSAAYTYDAMERMTRVTYPDGSNVDYSYNPRGLLKSIAGVVDAIDYDELGRAHRVSYANGVVEERTFDPVTFFLTRATVTGPARPEAYLDLGYAHDAVGNPLAIIDHVDVPGHTRFDREMTYDARYQLTSVEGVVGGNAYAHAYAYDAGGNIVSNGELGPAELTYEAGSNQLRGLRTGAVEDLVFAHDANGNLTASPGKALEYDARGRLVRVTTDDGTVVAYTYGFTGERVKKRVTVGGVTTETMYLDDLYEERDGAGRRHVYNGNTRVATFDGGLRISHRDHVGTPVLITDVAGAIVAEVGCHAFGSTAFVTGDPGTHRFIGDTFDEEVGLVYARSRYYDPALGRFCSPDLFTVLNPTELLTTPLHLNPYAYAGNNPLRFVDDDGAWWKWVVGALVIAVLIVATVVVGIATGGVGFAFGILLAASIGSAVGAGIGAYSAATSGGDPADGFLFGALVGGAAGALGYAAGAAVGAAGIGGAWGTILAGAAQGAVVGAANGAIAGYAGGAGSVEDVLKQAAIGFVIGAVVGGAIGYLSSSTPQVGGVTEKALTSKVQGTASEPFWRGVGQVAGRAWEPAAQATLNSLATPVGANVGVSLATGVAGFSHAAIYHDWDDIRAWLLKLTGDDEIIVKGPEIDF